jgi:hypothetical protein
MLPFNRKMFTQKDIYPDTLALYKKFNKDRTKIEHLPPNIHPMKWTTNLILNEKISHLKNAPIQNSHLKKAPNIGPYMKFKGAEALPTFKKDLKWWNLT